MNYLINIRAAVSRPGPGSGAAIRQLISQVRPGTRGRVQQTIPTLARSEDVRLGVNKL